MTFLKKSIVAALLAIAVDAFGALVDGLRRLHIEEEDRRMKRYHYIMERMEQATEKAVSASRASQKATSEALGAATTCKNLVNMMQAPSPTMPTTDTESPS